MEEEKCSTNHENAYLVLVDEAHYECPDCDYTWCEESQTLDDSEE